MARGVDPRELGQKRLNDFKRQVEQAQQVNFDLYYTAEVYRTGKDQYRVVAAPKEQTDTLSDVSEVSEMVFMYNASTGQFTKA